MPHFGWKCLSFGWKCLILAGKTRILTVFLDEYPDFDCFPGRIPGFVVYVWGLGQSGPDLSCMSEDSASPDPDFDHLSCMSEDSAHPDPYHGAPPGSVPLWHHPSPRVPLGHPHTPPHHPTTPKTPKIMKNHEKSWNFTDFSSSPDTPSSNISCFSVFCQNGENPMGKPDTLNTEKPLNPEKSRYLETTICLMEKCSKSVQNGLF